MQRIDNIRIESFDKLISPNKIRDEISLSEKSIEVIRKGREDFCRILNGEDKKMAVLVGPCSIHDTKAALEYARKIKNIRSKYEDKLFIMMRAYFEKPRTTIGWKGLINDPDMKDIPNIEKGLKIARKLLIEITEMGIQTATEILDPIIAAYVAELVSWVAIGARTTESQTHRQMASGLSAPVGFKNNTDGNLDVAINAMESAKSAHDFLGIDNEGHCSILKTKGNPNTHIVLRGGNRKPNYHMEDIEECEEKLKAKNFTPKIMIDCSHENSGKDYTKQKIVIKDIIAQKKFGNQSIFGIMLESNLFEGNQKIPQNLSELKYGVSITDSCIGWEETEELIEELYKGV